MKKTTEGRVRAALEQADLEVWVYKPPDDSRNWKPADYIVWFMRDPDQYELMNEAFSSFLEVKDVDTVRGFNRGELRPAQRRAIDKAQSMGIPYWLVVWWRRHRRWTVSDAFSVLHDKTVMGVPYSLMSSRYGIDCREDELGSMLRLALLDELRVRDAAQREADEQSAEAVRESG